MASVIIRNNESQMVLHRQRLPSGTFDLHGVSLASLDLSGAAMYAMELVGAPKIAGALARLNLRIVEPSGGDFVDTNLTGAVFSGATIVRADFSNANLSRAVFVRTHFIRCRFDKARMSGARFGNTSFTDCPTLHHATGLEELEHVGPTALDQETLRCCVGKLPYAFLLSSGYKKKEVIALRELYAKKITYSSCFISYVRGDHGFADHLRRALLKAGISCWQDTHDMHGGDHWRGQIYDAIKRHDKLVLICSSESLVRPAVVEEILEAIDRERDTRRQKLFPIRLDDYVLGDEISGVAKTKVARGEWRANWLDYIRSYHIPDFSGWRSPKDFKAEFGKLTKALMKPGRRRRAA